MSLALVPYSEVGLNSTIEVSARDGDRTKPYSETVTIAPNGWASNMV